MAVAGDHRSKSGSFRLQIKLPQIVEHVNQDSAELNNFRLEQSPSPSAFVHVAANGRQRSNSGEFLENLRRAHISGMNDVIRAAQRRHGLRPEQAMRVGDDADKNGIAQFLM